MPLKRRNQTKPMIGTSKGENMIALTSQFNIK